MAIYQVMYWADIPVQVRAKGSGGRAKAQLPERFQEAIDLAAMAVGWIGSDEYTNAYHWGEEQERAGTAQEVVDAVVAELEALTRASIGAQPPIRFGRLQKHASSAALLLQSHHRDGQRWCTKSGTYFVVW